MAQTWAGLKSSSSKIYPMVSQSSPAKCDNDPILVDLAVNWYEFMKFFSKEAQAVNSPINSVTSWKNGNHWYSFAFVDFPGSWWKLCHVGRIARIPPCPYFGGGYISRTVRMPGDIKILSKTTITVKENIKLPKYSYKSITMYNREPIESLYHFDSFGLLHLESKFILLCEVEWIINRCWY